MTALEGRIAGLEDLSIPDLKAAWTEAWGVAPPKGARRRLLMLGLAWKWQADRFGGHSKDSTRRLEALSDSTGRRTGACISAQNPLFPAAPRLRPGARLLRDWKGERHEVQVTLEGYLWRGRTYRSLSMIAREITGVRRNGPAFFGLRQGKAR